MERVERIIGLITSLLQAREPVPLSELRGWFPSEYGAVSDEAFTRKFERDKAAIQQLGVPLRYVQPDEDGDGGYVIDRDDVFLPPVDLDAEALTALTVAAAGALSQPEFPYTADLRRALDKIGIQLPDDTVAAARRAAKGVIVHWPSQQGDKLAARLELLAEAVAARHRIWVRYSDHDGSVTERELDPYRLRRHRVRWQVVGHCHLRDGLRTLAVDRIEELRLCEPSGNGPAFDPPAGLDEAAGMALPPWAFDVHEPREVELSLRSELAWLLSRQLGVRVEPGEGAWTPVSLTVTHGEALVQWVLGSGPNARLVRPPDLRARVLAGLRGALARHASEDTP